MKVSFENVHFYEVKLMISFDNVNIYKVKLKVSFNGDKKETQMETKRETKWRQKLYKMETKWRQKIPQSGDKFYAKMDRTNEAKRETRMVSKMERKSPLCLIKVEKH